ncbi:BMC domain-containing protein [Ignavibacterium sp.]|uniref:BMC domain-containing protein n=1 Tax=Ignavibacterium sp. TaxID=2651167 RepID=UPI00307E52EE
MNNSIAIIEVKGFCASVIAVDSILKNSDVDIHLNEIKNGNVLLKLKGNLPQIKYAFNLAVESINRITSVMNSSVLEKLNPSIEDKFFNNHELTKAKSVKPKDEKFQVNIELPHKEKNVEEPSVNVQSKRVGKPVEKKTTAVNRLEHSEKTSELNLSTIERLRLEALGKARKSVTSTNEQKSEKPKLKVLSSYNVKKLSDLDGLNVHKLRRVARDFEEFPIKGRQISIANRDELMVYFKQILPE